MKRSISIRLSTFINTNVGKVAIANEIAKEIGSTPENVRNYFVWLKQNKPDKIKTGAILIDDKPFKSYTFVSGGVKASDFHQKQSIKTVSPPELKQQQKGYSFSVSDSMNLMMISKHTGTLVKNSDITVQLLEDILDVLTTPKKGPEETEPEGATS